MTEQGSDGSTWTLGDRQVRRVGFGTMRLTGSAAFGQGPQRARADAVQVLRRAVELGVDHVDTAAFYFSATASSNELVNTALAPYPDHLTINTKVGPRRDASGEWTAWATPDQLRGQVEENLRHLGRDHVDVVYFRTSGRTASIVEHVEALRDVVADGLARHVGLSNVGTEQITAAERSGPVVAVQNRFGLDAHGPDDDAVLEACRGRGIAFVPFFAIAGTGRESGRTSSEHPTVERVAAAHGVSTARVRLAWTLHQGPHVLAIPGTGDLDHLADNVAAEGLRLDAHELAALDAVGKVA